MEKLFLIKNLEIIVFNFLFFFLWYILFSDEYSLYFGLL